MIRRKVIALSTCSSLLLCCLFWMSGAVMADSYTFGSESVTYGYSQNPSNRNAEDSAYNQILEEDIATDTNHSGDSENVVLGSAGGGSFPTALDTDDSTYRTYTEEDTGSGPYSDTQYLVPDADSDPGWTVYPASPSTCYDKVDEGVSHDSDTTYLFPEAGTGGITYQLGLSDLVDIDTGPAFDVKMRVWLKKTASQPCSSSYGVFTNFAYWGIEEVNAATSYTEYNYVWLVNPDTSSEWTEAQINGMAFVYKAIDYTPEFHLTSVVFEITINYSGSSNYELDSQVTYEGVESDFFMTIGHEVVCQGYRSGSENFEISAWNYTSSGWDSEATLNTGSDGDFNFMLCSHQISSEQVKIRVLGLTETGDTSQDTVYLDMLKVRQIDIGYAGEVILTASSVPEHGNLTIQTKGYTDSGSYWYVALYNYTTTTYDAVAISILDTSNSWQDEIDLCEQHHRDGTEVKVKIWESAGYDVDQSQTSLWLDCIFVVHNPSDPVGSDFGAVPETQDYGEAVDFFITVTDLDNHVLSYVRLYLNDTYYALVENNSGDTDTFDSKAWYLTKDDIPVGWYNYYFAFKDADSDEITTESSVLTITPIANSPPSFTSSPTLTWHNNTLYTYDADATDPDEDPLTFDLEGNITDWATIVPSTGYVSGTPIVLGQYWMNVSVTDGTFTVWQNSSLETYTDAPSFTSSPTLTWHNNTLYTYDADATDPESESLVFDLEGNITGWADIIPATGVVQGTPIVLGQYWMNVSVTDGTNTVWQNSSLETYTDAPSFTSWPSLTTLNDTEYTYNADATDPESETLVYHLEGNVTDWADIEPLTGVVSGTPTILGWYLMNVSVTDGTNTVWQNVTVEVVSELPAESDLSVILSLTLSIIIGSMLVLVGYHWELPWLIIGSGLVWMVASLSIYTDINIGLALLGVLVGGTLMYLGGTWIAGQSQTE